MTADQGQTPNASPGADVSISKGWFIVAGVLAAIAVGWPIAGAFGGAGNAMKDTAPGWGHVHSLAVDPRTDALYAATHTGLFRVRAGSAARVGDGNYYDLMGFAIGGPRRFLASGHPDVRSAELGIQPELLGLLESRDQGRSWEPLSLSGIADFHHLAVEGRTVYGANASTGEFMISADGGETWSTRSQPGLTSFVVAADEPGLVLGISGSGTLVSTDGGRTWKRSSAPPLAVVARDGNRVAALAPDGSFLVSDDFAGTWRRRGVIGAPAEALVAAAGDTFYAAGAGTGILVSDDGGRSWRSLFRAPNLAGGSQP